MSFLRNLGLLSKALPKNDTLKMGMSTLVSLSEKELKAKALKKQIKLTEKIVKEKCRVFRHGSSFKDYPNYDGFIWSEGSCKEASENLVEQVEALRKLTT